MRNPSLVADGWWDYTTLDCDILDTAAALTVDDIEQLGRDGFCITMYDSLEEFYLAEALEYVRTWEQSSADHPCGICGPIGPTEQLPLVARAINDLQIDVRDGHFWAMDEWFVDGREIPPDNPLSFARADKELCLDRIDPSLRMPDDHLHFLTADNVAEYSASYDQIQCMIMQGGQGDVKHWAFNDPLRREGEFQDEPPTPEQYRKLGARVVDLHPLTVMQNARTSGGGIVTNIPARALTVGPQETWKTETVSIWQAGMHDNPFGMRLTAYMISHQIADSSVPMSLLSQHPDVRFNFYRPGIGVCTTEMH